MTDKIELREEDGILRVAFNHVEKKNSILPEMYVALNEAFDRAANERSIRALLLESRGDIFTAGNDMASFLDLQDQSQTNPTLKWMKQAALSEKPLIAAVNGPAIGIGVTILCSFDLVYAAEEATFLTPFVNLGAVPEAGSSMLMPGSLGWQRAAEFLLTGEKVSARRAYDMGLVNKVVPRAELEETALAAARNIASKPPESVRLTKKLMKGDTTALIDWIDHEMVMFGERAQSEELREAVGAFLEKRKPDFSRFG